MQKKGLKPFGSRRLCLFLWGASAYFNSLARTEPDGLLAPSIFVE